MAAFREVQASHADVDLVLSDLYPNLPALRRAAERVPGRVTVIEERVDARAVARTLPGVCSIVNAFYHLCPADACAVLQDTARLVSRS